MSTNQSYHVPILLHECINALQIKPNGIYVDLTLGGGGHTAAIAQKLTTGKLYAFDQDEEAIENFTVEFTHLAGKVQTIHANFRNFSAHLKLNGVTQVDGILVDLGVSSHQLDVPERGFSYRYDAALDMRMSQQTLLTAKQIVNTYSENELARILEWYGECSQSRKIAHAIVRERAMSEIETTHQLTEICTPFAKKYDEYKLYGQVFQALRVEVNDELGALSDMLLQTPNVIKRTGVFAALTFHSIEDRIVKNFLKHGKLQGEADKDVFGHTNVPFKLTPSKHIEPTQEELKTNSRARSAKLRVAVRV